MAARKESWDRAGRLSREEGNIKINNGSITDMIKGNFI